MRRQSQRGEKKVGLPIGGDRHKAFEELRVSEFDYLPSPILPPYGEGKLGSHRFKPAVHPPLTGDDRGLLLRARLF